MELNSFLGTCCYVILPTLGKPNDVNAKIYTQKISNKTKKK